MSSTRALLLGSVVVIFAAAAVACGAGVDDDLDGPTSNDGGNNDGGGNPTGFGNNGTGAGNTGCAGPDCIGNTQQGMCDTGLDVIGTDPMDGARAIGICQVFQEGTWGVKSAEWVRSDGQPMTGLLLDGKGLLDTFGSNTPREGAAMLAISSGAGRAPGDVGFQDPAGYQKEPGTPHGLPPGYPKDSPSCPGAPPTGAPYDSAGLRLVIKTPTDAKSLSFNLNFYTYEYPDYICDQFNDFFVAMMSPTPMGLADGNISFDPMGNTISVNAGFLDVCTASMAGGKNFTCTQGYSGIPGTGFESNTFNFVGIPGSAATGWLETKAPVAEPGGEITMHFAIWDSGDAVLDSTTLIDNFKFELNETVTGTQPVPE